MAEDPLTEEQIAEFREAFSLIDKDSNGVITSGELAAVIHSVNKRPTKEEVQLMMKEIVSHGNGTIHFQHFLNFMSRKMKENVSEELKDAFTVIDRDQDGFISANELRTVMTDIGEKVSQEEAQQMINEADLNGDSLVSYAEFVRMMMEIYH